MPLVHLNLLLEELGEGGPMPPKRGEPSFSSITAFSLAGRHRTVHPSQWDSGATIHDVRAGQNVCLQG